MRVFIKIFISTLIFSGGILAIAINPDGTIKIVPYEKLQESQVKELGNDISKFHKQFLEYLPYLKNKKKASDNRYFHKYYQAETWEPRNPLRFLEIESIDVALAGNVIQSVTFTLEKNLTGKRQTNTRVTSQVINSKPNEGVDGIELRVTESGEGPDVVRIYNVNSIRDPAERLKLIRSYRNYIFESVQRIERIMMSEVKSGDVEIKNTLRDLR